MQIRFAKPKLPLESPSYGLSSKCFGLVWKATRLPRIPDSDILASFQPFRQFSKILLAIKIPLI